MSLRDELAGVTGPVAVPIGYTLLAPPDWGRFTADDAGRDQLTDRMRTRFQEVGRPDLYAEMRSLVRRQWQALQSRGAIEIYMPVVPPTQGGTPMTIVTVPWITQGRAFEADVRGRAQGDSTVESLSDGAGGTVYRWVNERRGQDDLAGVIAREITYVHPFPGPSPSRGIMIMASIMHPGVTEGGEALNAFSALADAIASTFVWRFA